LRSLDRAALEAIRIRAVDQVLGGETQTAVARAIGVAPEVVCRWVAAHRAGGIEALRARKAPGADSKLSPKQMVKLRDIIATKNPLQLKFEFALWTRGIVRDLIKRLWGITLGLTTVGALLKRLGFTAQKPMARAFEQDPIRVKHWLKHEFPKIKVAARKAHATIFFADESGVRSDHHSGKTWALKGQTPIVERTGIRVGCNMISAVAARGMMRFMVVKARVTTTVFIDFLKRLIRGATKPIFLIVDGHPTHRSKATREFVDSTKGMLRLFFLPPYSPELNPDELVWRHVKTHVVGRQSVQNREDLIGKISAAMRSLQRQPKKIRACFQSPTTVYASCMI
jgi:transposase